MTTGNHINDLHHWILSEGKIQCMRWLWHRKGYIAMIFGLFATEWPGLDSLGREPQVDVKKRVKPRRGDVLVPKVFGVKANVMFFQ